MKTTDGGNNWITKISGTSKNINSVCFEDANTGFAVGDSGTMLKTTDGGNNWDLKQVLSNKNLRSICFPYTDVGYAIGGKKDYQDDDIIIKTTDGGMNWTRMDSGFSFQKLYFVNVNVGYMISGENPTVKAFIYKTINGGESWTNQSTANVKHLFSIFFVNEDLGFAVGRDVDNRINIIKTKNGGDN